MRPISSPRPVSSTAVSMAPSEMACMRFFWRSSAPSTSRAISQDSVAISSIKPMPIAPSSSVKARTSASMSST
ncbi:hypothetical protein ACVWZL_003069 [Bradyrhizobium sp. GM2.4]